ncbi:MAG: YcnI family protein [Hyphomonadaceae bacterium]|nr:YcnI family protein [Hyphomonadaceae bacterium]
MKYKKFTGLILLAGLVGALPGAAHVTFETKSVEAGAMQVAGFRVFHGCDGSETVEVSIEIPEGLKQVRPRNLAGWRVSIEKQALEAPYMLHGMEVTERVSRITWSGGTLPDFAFQKFEFNARFPDRAGETLYFPVRQTCVEGGLNWVSHAGPHEAEFPAPRILLAPASVQDNPHH